MFKFFRHQLLVMTAVLSWASLLPAQVFSVGSYPVSSGTLGVSNIATAPDGSLWYLGSNGSGQNFAVQVSAGGTATQYPLASVTSSPIGSSITTGPDGALWFTAGSGASAVIARITTAGAISTFTVPSASAFANQPGAITAGSDGALWFTDSGNPEVWRVTTGGTFTNFALSNPSYGITKGPDGNIWTTEYAIKTNGQSGNSQWSGSVASITPAGVVAEFAMPQQGVKISSNVENPIDTFAIGSDGALWFTEYNGTQAGRASTSGTITTPYTGAVNGITSGSDGALWLTQPAGPALVRLTTAGATSTQNLNATFTTPFGISKGSDGALWFNDSTNPVIGHAVIALAVTAACPAPKGAQNTAYSFTLTASGGQTPLTWSVPAGTLPPGLSLNSSTGVISGTPSAGGTTNLTATVTDSATPTPQTANFTCNNAFVITSQLTIPAATLPNGQVGAVYPNTQLQSQGGTSPYTWSVTGGSLPMGLMLSGAGVISGTPGAPGTSTFTVTAQDSSSPAQTATQQFTISVGAGAPAGVAAVSGGGQSAAINSAFASPLVAKVSDGSGNPVAGVPVTFTAPGTGASGTFAGAGASVSVNTNSSGVATSPVFTANGVAGAYSVNASASGVSGAAAFALTNAAGPAANISATSGSGQTAPVNGAFGSPLAALVKDASGNPVANVSVTFTTPGSGASATFAGAGATFTTMTNASGVATSAALTANAVAGSFSVSASVGGVSAPATFSLTNTAAPPASITATSGSGQTAQVNGAFGSPLAAVVKDASGNPVANVSVTFTAPGSGASATFAGAGATFTMTTNGAGVATSAALTANAVAGNFSVSASVAGVSNPALFALTNTAGAPASISATTGGGQTAQINNTFGSPLVAVVKDSAGNGVANVTVTFAAPGSGASGMFSGAGASAAVMTNASGIATAPALTANSTAGGYNVNASVSGVGGQATFALTNTAGAPASITATSGSGQSVQINNGFNTLSATVKDSGGNPVANATVTFTAPAVNASGSFAGGALTVMVQTNAAGVASAPTFTANGTAGSYNVTATVPGVSGVATFALTNNAGGPASITANSGGGQSARVTTAFTTPLVATVKDNGGNPVANVTVTFAAPGAGASGTFAGSGNSVSVQTNAAGVATSPVFTANGAAGSYTVNASVNGVSGQASYPLTNTAGAPGSISATAGNFQSAAINSAFGSPFTVTVKDATGNAVANATVTFAAPGSGASGTFAGAGTTATATTNSSGVATSATFNANAMAGSYVVTASVPGAATPANFNLTNNAGTATNISIASGTFQSARANSAFSNPLVVLVKDAGGNSISGVSVTFTAPGSGAGGVFAGGGITATVQTNTSGVATSPIFTANGTAGSYSVFASVPGVSGQLTFALTNLTGIGITPTTLPGGMVGVQYSVILTIQNGTAPYHWSVSNGNLATGLTLNLQSGEITGTPTVAGTFTFTVMATDSTKPSPQSAMQGFTLIIASPSHPVLPTFTISGIPSTSAPGANITSGTVQLSQVSADAFSGSLNLSFAPNSSLSGLPSGYAGDGGFVSGTMKSSIASVTVPAGTMSVAIPTVDPGTVAGKTTVTLTVGGQDVASSTVTIAAAAPIIEANSVQITNVTTSGFDVELVATSTTRELKNVVYTFAAAPGDQIAGTTTFTVDVTSLLSQWFSSSSGLTYGGAFTLTIPFSVSGSASAIGSVSVTATNSIGTSAPVSGTQ